MFSPPVKTKATTARTYDPGHSQSEGWRPRGGIAEQAIFQRTIGNQATLRRLTQRSNPTSLPRNLQPKLIVGAVNDPLEDQADRVAGQVMRMPDPALADGRVNVGASDAQVQRACAKCDEDERKLQPKPIDDTAPSVGSGTTALVDEVLRSPGQSLDTGLRAFFEPRVRYDLGGVRVHTDNHAQAAADAVAARAFTVGRDIVFAAGQYAPQSAAGRYLLAHELTHVAQQGAAPQVTPGAYSLTLHSDGGETRFGPPPMSITGVAEAAPEGPGPAQPGAAGSETTMTGEKSGAQAAMPDEMTTAPEVQRLPQDDGLLLQRTATFSNPTPQPQDPLVRLAHGLTPGLTTPTINGNKVASDQDIVAAITPSQAKQTGSSGGNVTCEFTNSAINTSAEQIVASAAGPTGWTANVPPDQLGNPAQCAKVQQVPTTMNAQPNNADFVKRVQTSENEHVAELHTLHDRHFVPYDQFITGLHGSGADLAACGQNLVGQLGGRPRQAALGFALGNAAQVQKLDGPGGTHSDDGIVNAAKDCSSATITLKQTTPTIAGAAPGNVVTVNPTVTNFDPKKLKAVGKDLRDGKTTVKSFSSAANANAALAVIQHYGMDSRNVIGPMEVFLVGGKAPSGAMAGANELAIDPTRYQVSLNLPQAGNWAITDTGATATAVNVNVIVNFGAARDAAYSAWNVMTSFGFTFLGWVGGTRQAPEMMYFRV
jgi:Domain of unknown function (DUF4157)